MPGIVEQLVGSMLGEYRIERLLGQSPLGAAYLAVQPERGLKVMVTTFNFPEGQAIPERDQFRSRFAREGAALTRLVHAHVLPIYAFGEQPGYLYLVTAFVKEASLGQTLKQNTRFTPQQVLHVLKQLAAGLDYVHSQGITHGMLSLANIVMGSDLHVGIAGFGLRTMLEIHGNAQSTRPLAHLSSSLGAFLGSPEYISPERVLGLPIDARADIYALGVMLFALLSGEQPFRGTTPLDIALRRLQQPAPPVHAACPAVPEAFDLVIGRALERDPARRFSSAGELAQAIERVVTAQDAAHIVKMPASDQAANPGAPLTLPPTVNWFDEQLTPSGRWQVAPMSGAENIQPVPSAMPGGIASFTGEGAASLAGVDPFTWWSASSGAQKMSQSTPATLSRRSPLRLRSARSQTRARPGRQERRKMVTLLITGAVSVSALTVGGITFANLTRSMNQSRQLANAPDSDPTGAPVPTGSARQTPGVTTTPPAHTGTVIGSATLAVNSAQAFTNPADGVGSLLIHLTNGTFVACERTCPHKGVAVDYDPKSKMLVCPAHNAIFDPRHGFSHVSGPGSGPLTRVTVHANGDGTITTL